ncbi:MAG: MgtC/SapB family protein [Candidatus Margulisiibacteriota bacterium]|jgi:putative Mg2+ transporter-C (MgtC) family protein
MQELISMVDLTVVYRLLLSGLLGGIIGAEREYAGKPSGFRTSILICMGSALFVHLALFSMASYNIGDPTRVIGQVITGIGFLGAGTIIQSGGSVLGMTSAATIWVVSGIGMAVGIGDYFSATVSTVLIFIVLTVLNVLERKVKSQLEKMEKK